MFELLQLCMLQMSWCPADTRQLGLSALQGSNQQEAVTGFVQCFPKDKKLHIKCGALYSRGISYLSNNAFVFRLYSRYTNRQLKDTGMAVQKVGAEKKPIDSAKPKHS